LQKYDGNFFKIWQDGASHPALRRLLALHFELIFLIRVQALSKTAESFNLIELTMLRPAIKFKSISIKLFNTLTA